jgi:hypothetical protein
LFSKNHCTATGCLSLYVHDAEDLEKLLGIVRLGVAIKAQHVGRRPGFLRCYLQQVFEDMHGDVTFERFIDRLENSILEPGSPIEIVKRKFLFLTYFHPKEGRKECTFKTLENYLSSFKNKPNPG